MGEMRAEPRHATDAPVAISAFRCHHVSSPGGFTVTADNLVLPARRVLPLVGGNGAGKTTFLRGLAAHQGFAVVRRDVTSGVLFHYVHQTSERSLFPSLRVAEAVFVLTAPDRGGVWRLSKVPPLSLTLETLPETVLTDVRKWDGLVVEELSGGQRAVLALVAACVAFPRHVLLLDEPDSGLDASRREEVARYLVSLAEGRGMPIIVASHNAGFVKQLGGAALTVDGGRVVPAE